MKESAVGFHRVRAQSLDFIPHCRGCTRTAVSVTQGLHIARVRLRVYVRVPPPLSFFLILFKLSRSTVPKGPDPL